MRRAIGRTLERSARDAPDLARQPEPPERLEVRTDEKRLGRIRRRPSPGRGRHPLAGLGQVAGQARLWLAMPVRVVLHPAVAVADVVKAERRLG